MGATPNQTPDSVDEVDRLLDEYEGMDNCGDTECINYQCRLEYLSKLEAIYTARFEAAIGPDENEYWGGMWFEGIAENNETRAEARTRWYQTNQDGEKG